MSYLVLGCGGIGKALGIALEQQHQPCVIFSRKPANHHHLDIRDVATLDDYLSHTLPEVIIQTAGMLHTDDHLPEKNIKQLNIDWLNQSIEANVLPTVKLAQSLSMHMTRHASTKLIALSARVGSIEDNRLGGWYSYRMSKAMLNMLLKNLAIEWSRYFPHASVYGYHPGTVDTPMSAPFKANVKPEQLFSPAVAAQHLLDVIPQMKAEDSGKIFDWQGQIIPY